MNSPAERGRFAGAAQILRFNWPQYVLGLAVAGGALTLAGERTWPSALRIAFMVAGGLALWWTLASLVVSHWVYDRSELCRWRWLRETLPAPPCHWLNVHAGLDESTPALRTLWPEAVGEVADIFTPAAMSERSIYRARTEQQAVAHGVDFRALPYATASFDTAFLLFAVHELRVACDRQAFFIELRRILTADGQAVLVEHCRDAANWAAFGFGFLHFHSRRTWLINLETSGFQVARTFRVTPFVRVFLLTPQP